MKRRSVIDIEPHEPARRTGGMNVLARRLEADDVPTYLVDVIVALREAAEEADKRIAQIERVLARLAMRDAMERAR